MNPLPVTPPGCFGVVFNGLFLFMSVPRQRKRLLAWLTREPLERHVLQRPEIFLEELDRSSRFGVDWVRAALESANETSPIVELERVRSHNARGLGSRNAPVNRRSVPFAASVDF